MTVASAAAVLAVAAAAQQPPDANEHSVNGADCYGCHKVWSPVPMRTMFTLAPADSEPAAVGDALEFGVEVQQAWLARPPWPKLTQFEASVDLSAAPSLGFVSQVPPVLGVQRTGAIDPPERPIDTASGFVLVEVPPGTSELVITLQGDSTDPLLGPDLAMVLHPGRLRPGSEPYRNLTVNDAGRGQLERLVISGNANVSELGPGPWALQAILQPTESPAGRDVQAEVRSVGFTVTLDAYRNTTGEARQTVVVERTVEAGGATILPFQLRVLAPPAAGERVQVDVTSTAYYPHTTGGGRDDTGNITKRTSVGVVARDGGVVLETVQPAGVVTTALFPWARLSEAVGYAAAFLLVSSIVSGGMFGAASRRGLNVFFGSAKRRVAFHNALSYLILVAATLHTVVFLVEANYAWTLGLIWGGIAILAMFGLGVTGAFQVAVIRRWGFGAWKWLHFGLAVAAIVFTIVHALLDGANFGAFQEAVGWENPFPDARETAAGASA